MKSIRSLFLWMIGLTFFVIFSIVIILFSFLFPLKTIDPFVKSFLKLLFKLLFIKVEVKGNVAIDSSKTYLLMANHVSIFDVPLLKAYIPHYCIGVEAHHQFKWPVYGWLISRLGTIPIERTSIYSSMRSMEKAKVLLQAHTSIAILPEGGRTLNGSIQPFKKMPFHLAKQAEVGIIPIGLSGLYKLKPKGKWHITPTTITIYFGDPITSETVNKLSIEELKDHVRDQIIDLIIEP